tara:strand:- start:32938 stop:33321 length:384 start_codon:yes stop_codon:yes gene_type:complete
MSIKQGFLPDQAITIYKFPLTGESDFNTGDDDFEFVGAYRFMGNGYIFVPKTKVSKIATQPDEAKLSKVTNMKEIAAFYINSGISVFPQGHDENKLASFKTWGYDLIDEYTDVKGIEEASAEWMNAQ